MRAPQRLEQTVQEVASLLIPMQDQQLLVPNVTVAEIIPLAQITTIEGAPTWYLGNMQWREQTIPVLSYEQLNGDARASSSGRARFAVFNTTGLHESLPFIALLTQGLPRLARVSEEEITQREDMDNKPFELMHVTWAGEEAVIPDVPAIERHFLDYLQQ